MHRDFGLTPKDGRDIDGFEFIINWCKRLKTARRFAWLLFNKEKR